MQLWMTYDLLILPSARIHSRDIICTLEIYTASGDFSFLPYSFYRESTEREYKSGRKCNSTPKIFAQTQKYKGAVGCWYKDPSLTIVIICEIHRVQNKHTLDFSNSWKIKIINSLGEFKKYWKKINKFIVFKRFITWRL